MQPEQQQQQQQSQPQFPSSPDNKQNRMKAANGGGVLASQDLMGQENNSETMGQQVVVDVVVEDVSTLSRLSEFNRSKKVKISIFLSSFFNM